MKGETEREKREGRNEEKKKGSGRKKANTCRQVEEQEAWWPDSLLQFTTPSDSPSSTTMEGSMHLHTFTVTRYSISPHQRHSWFIKINVLRQGRTNLHT